MKPKLAVLPVLRGCLVVIAALQAGLAAAGLHGRSHAGHEVAIWGVSASVGLLTAAARPRTAAALLPVLACACVISAVIAVRDITEGQVDVSGEAPHLLLAGGILLLSLMSGEMDSHAGADRTDAITWSSSA
jgi:predicted anti-sigma-YlaC factor YlaD